MEITGNQRIERGETKFEYNFIKIEINSIKFTRELEQKSDEYAWKHSRFSHESKDEFS